MEGIVPGPRGETLVVVLAIKLQSLDVFDNDFLKLLRAQSVLNFEPACVVIFDALNDLVILHLEFLQLAVILLGGVICAFFLVEDTPIIVGGLPAFPLSLHLADHVGFESFS